jgi:hypothetical protein
MRNYLFVFIAVLLIASCQSERAKVYYDTDPNNREIKIIEVLQTSSYTYLKVTETQTEYWMAVASIDASKGDVLYFTSAMEMDDFYSKDLDRTFDKILFVSDISRSPIPLGTKQSATEATHSPHGEMKPVATKKDINIQPTEGSITIAELFANKHVHVNQVVKVVGEVTRYNPQIMSRNWVHLQDGTDDNGNYDLTVTTLDQVKVGDKVIIEGKVTLDKDFGAGYYYTLIVEDANVNKLVAQ